MKKSFILFFFLSFFNSAHAQSCIQFAEDLGFNTWNNQGICLGVSREVNHKCYSYEANKRKLDCSIPSSDGWSCKKGYVKKGQKCEADTYVPKNAFKTASGWSCNFNYIKNSSGNACKSLPSNSYKTSESSFRCNYGYEKNISGSGCILKKTKQQKTKPDNSYFTNLTAKGWKCRGGYVQDNNNCVLEADFIPDHAISFGNSWVCGSNYTLNETGNGCQKVPLNGYSSRYSNSWDCKANYQKSGDRCILKTPKLKAPNNATVFGNTWRCDFNYRLTIAKNGCEKVPSNAYSTAGSNGWGCISGYEKYGRICKERVVKRSSEKESVNENESVNVFIEIAAAIMLVYFLLKIFTKKAPPSSSKPKAPKTEKPKTATTEKPRSFVVKEPKLKKENKTEKPKTATTEKPRSFVVKEPKLKKENKTEKPKTATTEKPRSFVVKEPKLKKENKTEKPKTATTEKPRSFVVKEPKLKKENKTAKTKSRAPQKFYAKNSLSLGDIETQKKKINWKNTLDGISKINNSSVGYLIPTKTGLTKGIFDATKELREFLFENNIHDYENYPFGEKKRIPVQLVTEKGIFSTSITLYRPNNKKPFPRLSISGINKFVEPKDLLVFKVIDNVLYIINNAHDGTYDYAHLHLKYVLNFNKLLSEDKLSFEQNKLYSRKDIGLICLPKTGRPKGGMWDTGYVRVKNNLIIFMNIGVPGRTEHDFNNSVNERSKTIMWYGKPNSHSFQPTIGKLISGELTPYFFARWDSSNVNFKFLGIGKIEYWRDGTPTVTGSGDKAETIEIKLTYQSVDDKKLITEPKSLNLIWSDKQPKVEPKVNSKVEPKVKPKVEPKVETKNQSTKKAQKNKESDSEKFTILNFDQFSDKYSKLVSSGVESIDAPTILGLMTSDLYEGLVKEKLKNNINQNLLSKELIGLEKKAIKSYSENIDFKLQKKIIQSKENPLFVASIYSSDEELNNLSSVICNEEAYLLAQIGMQPSDEIYAILQHQLMVSGKDKIKYLSYWKGQVCIAADIDRNDKFIETLIQSEKDFLKKL